MQKDAESQGGGGGSKEETTRQCQICMHAEIDRDRVIIEK